ncbi:hypothetical protein SAE02_59670 [Skermanella aerolata]|uniref:Bacterial virulence protein VirB8 domain-containing protein n=1 Tax=Skermanella aerolata TaxID=393310 RepID=A0A512DZF4_9PROT|nr:hypothetical protein [Skermanella aerolata]KJB90653.1 hypothetical protein N826_36665 [Skermanella aerolata KACC 11604]GEO41819.1 hypothetical protein SAE02_59670 [Skermanella aerolata]
MFEKIRIRRTQPIPTTPPAPRFTPGWLAQQQRTTLRMLALGLVSSLGLNGYQVYKREQIAVQPPEVFAALLDADFASLKVIRANDLKADEFEAASKAEVKRLVYRLRRIDSPAQVQEMIDTLYCSVTGMAAVKANRSFERSAGVDMVRKGQKRIVSEKEVQVGRRPGERSSADGMWIGATWPEIVDDGMRRTTVQHSAEFRVQQFKAVSSEIRNCNPMGILVTDYEIFGSE